MGLIIFPSFIAFVILIIYFISKNKLNRNIYSRRNFVSIKSKKTLKQKKEIKKLEFSRKDNKLINKLFMNKVNLSFYSKSVKSHSLTFGRGDKILNGRNVDYDFIKVNISKLFVNSVTFYNIEIYGWKKLINSIADEEPDLEITDFILNAEISDIVIPDSVNSIFRKVHINENLFNEIKVTQS